MEMVDEWVLALSSDNGGEIGLYRVYATKTDMKNFMFRMIKRARAFGTHGAWKHGQTVSMISMSLAMASLQKMPLQSAQYAIQQCQLD